MIFANRIADADNLQYEINRLRPGTYEIVEKEKLARL
jgi:hypothetical protein